MCEAAPCSALAPPPSQLPHPPLRWHPAWPPSPPSAVRGSPTTPTPARAAPRARWYDSTLVRMRNEPVRHEMVCLLGILSLLARPGHAGIPVGHIVQYKVRGGALRA